MVLLLDYANPGYLRGNSFDPDIFTGQFPRVFKTFLVAASAPHRTIDILVLSGMKNPE
jgi:hypothetical protein